jgi:hypothetical protein
MLSWKSPRTHQPEDESLAQPFQILGSKVSREVNIDPDLVQTLCWSTQHMRMSRYPKQVVQNLQVYPNLVRTHFGIDLYRDSLTNMLAKNHTGPPEFPKQAQAFINALRGSSTEDSDLEYIDIGSDEAQSGSEDNENGDSENERLSVSQESEESDEDSEMEHTKHTLVVKKTMKGKEVERKLTKKQSKARGRQLTKIKEPTYDPESCRESFI